MIILAFESSCDETSAAVVSMGSERRVLSNIVASQIETHKLYGGVVPEIASRCHAEAIANITYEALETAGITLNDVEAVGVTNTPGLIGALLVGVNFAKALAFSNSIPLVSVNHIRGHVAANYFEYQELNPPFTALVASGGHTSLIDVKGHTDFVAVGRTRDDAIGEAFDKIARVMGLPYPGGAMMDKLASEGDPDAVKFPSAAIHDDTLDFSFSGLKTAVINYIHNMEQKGIAYKREDVAASFTKTVVRSVISKLDRCASDKIVLAGGVAANSHLRNALSDYALKHGRQLYLPPKSLCGDNAAMIGAQAYYEFVSGNRAGTELNAIV